jgi:exopolyphosphatase/guanosine-5'-triphosphate,3'-diphosphate pyrophosphatase
VTLHAAVGRGARPGLFYVTENAFDRYVVGKVSIDRSRRQAKSITDLDGHVLAAIDVGTNAVRLKLARPLPNGSLEALHEERDPVRPGEGVFKTRLISREVADRVLSTLRRYAALCRRYRARVRAIGTSAVREAHNKDEVLARVRREAGLELEVVSGREEARLTCLGVLRGKPANAQSLVVDIGGGSTEIASARGERPVALWSLSLGAVRLSEIFDAGGAVRPKDLRMMRQYAGETVAEALPRNIQGAPRMAIGSSGTIRAVVSFAAAEGTDHATRRQLTTAVDDLVAMGVDGRRERFDPRRADIIVAGAVVLEALAHHMGLKSVIAVDAGLRDGVLVDLMRRRRGAAENPPLAEAAVALGRRFYFDERHARQVTRLALTLFDNLAELHRLPAAARPLLEAAALLHDVGNSVSYQRHHKHTYYLVQNADIPGLADRQRELVARVARFHRGSAPEPAHPLMAGLTLTERQLVRKLSTLLRIADSFDRSHHQPVQKLHARVKDGAVHVRLTSRTALDLELWDAQREALPFRRMFDKRLIVGSIRS